jgi:hypothetical protein
MLDRMTMRYRKPSEQIVRDLIFYTLGYVLPPEAAFTQLEAYEPVAEDPLKRDTKVLVYIPDHVYSRSHGARWIKYRRLDLGLLEKQGQGQLTAHTFPFSTYDILDQINLLYNIDLSHDDVQDVAYVDSTQPYKLIAKPGSLAWQNTLVLDVAVPSLPNLVSDAEPPGFVEATPTPA